MFENSASVSNANVILLYTSGGGDVVIKNF
jgi:hypothetical protein